uniref:Uncharacterized protein n=1 Tax=Oryza glumipatula TaxID=40148 RepID=A0A0D9ZFY3_9ORYZ
MVSSAAESSDARHDSGGDERQERGRAHRPSSIAMAWSTCLSSSDAAVPTSDHDQAAFFLSRKSSMLIDEGVRPWEHGRCHERARAVEPLELVGVAASAQPGGA